MKQSRAGQDRITGWLTAALLTAGSAGAQDLGAYRALAADLDGAVTARTTSAALALSRLDAATPNLEKLAPSLSNRQLVAGLQGALDGARGALARSPAELEAQILLARGLMRKALYDQTLSRLASTPLNGTAQLRLLASEFGLSGEAAQALSNDGAAGRLPRVAWRVQREAARKISEALNAAQPTQSSDTYLNLARGMAWFTAVQDASGASELKVSQFGDALRQLTAGDVAALRTSLTALRQGNSVFLSSLALPPSGAAQATPVDPVTATPGPASAPVTVTSGPASTTAAQTRPTPAGRTVARLTTTTTGEIYAALGRALSAAGHGNSSQARQQLGQATTALAKAPPSLRSAQGYDTLVFDLGAAQARAALRPEDVQVLIATLTALEQRAAGQPTSALDSVSAGVSRGFGGWLRVLVFALLALLAFVPLYLLNLAFGGRNTFWRAIAAGLALLLLPAFLEGLFGLLGAIGDLSGIGTLAAASNFTLTQNAYGLPLWALTVALAIGLSTFGFRGLCQQFGLLGRRSAPTQDVAAAQSLDWDEDL
ncbi:hypothetical protein [Deinococcus humi]|uniref:Uncharacterized protein n=1 Tax=Deinococcus humi TaxID=662880 RepID=A0A7W8JZY0_9DEIO|nr:hypothetical protein [Deinococcus humi]MBB5364886.1 hypothetical protein [Deinococcus humi]GGO33767.1 hypothetical protein GCM10008949_33490 [Deinococcus humi]